MKLQLANKWRKNGIWFHEKLIYIDTGHKYSNVNSSTLNQVLGISIEICFL